MFKRFESWVEALPDDEPTKPPTGVYAFCRHYTKGYELPLILMSVLTAMLAMLEVSLFGFMGQLVDWLVKKNPETLFQDEGTTLMLMGGMVIIVMPILVLLHALIMHQTLLGNYPMSIRWLAHRYLLKQSVSFYQDDFAGRIATKVMQTSLAVRETVMKLLDVLVYILVYFTSMLVMIASADLRLVIPMLVWLALYVGLQWYFVPRLKSVSTEQADARSTMTGRIVDSYTNITTVKLFAHTQKEAEYAKSSMRIFLDTVYRQMRLVTGISVSVQIINYLLAFSIAAVSIALWTDSAITVGAIAIAVSLALRLNGMSQWIMWEISSLFENIGTVTDGMNTLSKTTIIQDEPNAKALVVNHGKIDFNQVCFHYGEQTGVIEDLNLNIKAGEKVGLVGRSGAGKSTLVNLLMRFYDVEKGQINIDDQDIKMVMQDSLRSQIGMVTQDTSLLHRTIRENILYGNPSASEEQLDRAIKQAQAYDFIQELSDPNGNHGLDAQVGERGVKLSGGQRQRIAIARVLLKNAPILLLDEATSALDSEVEAAIQESLYELMQGKTVIAIAHRLSTIAAMDRLIVLDQGRVVEQGTHHELIAAGGIYAQLWAHQTGGFLGVD
ncbi:ABC transporter ATP-binding protein/permease [Shewanella sp. NKUCC05_KAH]|jgi:ATP-binding cassette subfamily B multidrug efflux pump|uniref:ABC transporter ATP-binding protein n=1 Tax=Shewanella oncorhynchi TaxID=2726434 RepID=A0ABX1KKK8_9GAMM|nr:MULTISPECIES: ABC transporter ATP-binding protein [Shewanella]RBP77457.1 ATP-binding cassette subfamily B multidrug efflux pump [Shewanella putrefaciens]GCF91534.1 multidrug ABC transporter ATP-binding protein [Shewanella sp. M-Br]MBI1674713.1 ABC transporter ATP-binding protein [Shewanella sp. DW31]MBS0044706.1 ABC transporter ATP-binding protein [Shewanella sp. M16]MBW3526838.1 ABC transporter ATP-binding protein/permease [Shewanella sp. NKUCC05_KAH]